MNFDRVKAVHAQNNVNILEVKPGMFLEIHEKLSEGDWKRVWRFKWLVIKVKNPNQADGTFTIRWTVAGNEIEKIYPLSFKKFEKVLLLDEYKVRRAKLYYIREKIWKDARMKSKITADRRNKNILK